MVTVHHKDIVQLTTASQTDIAIDVDLYLEMQKDVILYPQLLFVTQILHCLGHRILHLQEKSLNV